MKNLSHELKENKEMLYSVWINLLTTKQIIRKNEPLNKNEYPDSWDSSLWTFGVGGTAAPGLSESAQETWIFVKRTSFCDKCQTETTETNLKKIGLVRSEMAHRMLSLCQLPHNLTLLTTFRPFMVRIYTLLFLTWHEPAIQGCQFVYMWVAVNRNKEHQVEILRFGQISN